MIFPTASDLLAAACHVGHRSAKWNPKMKPYLCGTEKGIHIFDPAKTAEGLREVSLQLQGILEKGGTLLLATRKPQCTDIMTELAKKTELPVVAERWMPGLLTNWAVMKKRIQSYLDLKHSFQSGEVEKYTKKEQMKLRKYLAKLDRAFSGVASLKHLPDALLVLDSKLDRIAILEARVMRIPVFGICDSNGDPDLYTAFIPANDDSIHSIALILRSVEDAIFEARSKRSAKEAKEKREKKETEKQQATPVNASAEPVAA